LSGKEKESGCGRQQWNLPASAKKVPKMLPPGELDPQESGAEPQGRLPGGDRQIKTKQGPPAIGAEPQQNGQSAEESGEYIMAGTQPKERLGMADGKGKDESRQCGEE